MISKIKWVLLGVTFFGIKKLLRYRLRGDSAKWLQPLKQNNVAIFNREDFIIDACREKRVLHIGFSDYPYTIEKHKNNELLHTRIKEVASYSFGVDNNQQSIEEYTAFTNDSGVAYTNILENYPKHAVDKNFDLIVLSEVLEHLTNPYKAVDILYKTFKHGTKVLVTVPNYTSLVSLAASLNNTESIHPHHHWYFSPFTLLKLFDESKFICEQINFGMYYTSGVKINVVLKGFPFCGDCIMAVFTIKKQNASE